MAQGDDTTREETEVRTDRASGGRGPEPRHDVPAGPPAADASPASSAPRHRSRAGSPFPPVSAVDEDDPSTDELETVDATEAPSRPSVLPPDVAAARTAMHRRTTEIPIVAVRYGEDEDVDPLADDEADAEPADEAAPHGHRPHVVVERRAGLWFTIALLTVLLIGTATLAAYLWHVSDEWEAQVAELTDVSYGLGDDLATERETLAAAEDRIDLLNDQLATSKDTVTRLQAENARWGDDAVFAQEEISQLRDLIASGTAATGSLSRCIEAHDQLVEYLQTPDDYAPEEIVAFQDSVAELCTEAGRAAQEFTAAAAG